MDGFMEGPSSNPDDWVLGIVRENLAINGVETASKQDVAVVLFEAWDFIQENFDEFNANFKSESIPLKPIDIYVEFIWSIIKEEQENGGVEGV